MAILFRERETCLFLILYQAPFQQQNQNTLIPLILSSALDAFYHCTREVSVSLTKVLFTPHLFPNYLYMVIRCNIPWLNAAAVVVDEDCVYMCACP